MTTLVFIKTFHQLQTIIDNNNNNNSSTVSMSKNDNDFQSINQPINQLVSQSINQSKRLTPTGGEGRTMGNGSFGLMSLATSRAEDMRPDDWMYGLYLQ